MPTVTPSVTNRLDANPTPDTTNRLDANPTPASTSRLAVYIMLNSGDILELNGGEYVALNGFEPSTSITDRLS